MKKNLKIIVLSVILLFVVAGAVTTALILKKRKADKTVNIAFYGISEEYENLIKKYIPETEDVILNFTTIADGKFEPGIISSKYDMLFTWQGEYTELLKESAEDIPGKVLENIPVSLRNKKYLPLLLDHFELDFYMDAVTKLDAAPANNFDSFIDYLNNAKSQVFSPFFMAGGNDRNLLAFIGSIIEAQGGVESYKKFLQTLKGAENLESIMNEDLGNNLTLGKALEMLSKWPAEGLTHPMWYAGTDTDLIVFTDDNQVGVFFTNLLTHRKMAYKTVSKFETSGFPRGTANVNHGIIAPAICVMLISDNNNCKKYVRDLMTEEVQSAMSNETMLGPVHYRAETYDRQADDVRFWAASCAAGALPDPALAVYQKNPDSLANIAKEIRDYLKVHRF